MANDMTASPRRTRARILDAAQRQFADLGFDATPVASVASEAGVPKGLVFHYFPTKRDLLLTLLRERPQWDAPDPPPGGGAARGDLAEALLAVAHWFHTGGPLPEPLRRIVFREGGRHPEALAAVERLTSEVARRVREAIDRSLPGPAPDDDSREAAVTTFTAALLHSAGHPRSAGDEPDLGPVARLVATALGATGGRGRRLRTTGR